MYKFIITCITLAIVMLPATARTRYEESMEPFIGVWTMQDKLGNDYEYKFQVVDGWLVLRYKFVDNYSQGKGNSATVKKNPDYTYENGCFYYKENHPECDAYNSISLYLKEGSLIESNHHRSPGTNTVYKNTYEKE